MKCVTKIMAGPGTRTTAADQCVFRLTSRNAGGPGFANASVRTVANVRQVGTRTRSKSAGTHRHARVDASNAIEKREQTGTRVRQVARGSSNGQAAEKGSAGAENAGTEEESRRCKEDTGLFTKSDKSKGTSHVQDEVEKLMHQDEQELLSLWEGWHWFDDKGGWLDQELCAKARREEVEYIRRHKMYTRVHQKVCLRETGKAPIKTGAETDKGQPGKPDVREVGREGIQDTRKARDTRANATEAPKVVLSEIATSKAWRKGCGTG